jgi:hypothetical protein
MSVNGLTAAFFRSIDQPTAALRTLATHFSMSGLPGKFYPVRHGFRHSTVTAVIAHKINDFPLPFTVVEYTSEAIAESHLQSSQPAWLAQRKGSLIIHFAMWGDDTRAMIDRGIRRRKSIAYWDANVAPRRYLPACA